MSGEIRINITGNATSLNTAMNSVGNTVDSTMNKASKSIDQTSKSTQTLAERIKGSSGLIFAAGTMIGTITGVVFELNTMDDAQKQVADSQAKLTELENEGKKGTEEYSRAQQALAKDQRYLTLTSRNLALAFTNFIPEILLAVTQVAKMKAGAKAGGDAIKVLTGSTKALSAETAIYNTVQAANTQGFGAGVKPIKDMTFATEGLTAAQVRGTGIAKSFMGALMIGGPIALGVGIAAIVIDIANRINQQFIPALEKGGVKAKEFGSLLGDALSGNPERAKELDTTTEFLQKYNLRVGDSIFNTDAWNKALADWQKTGHDSAAIVNEMNKAVETHIPTVIHLTESVKQTGAYTREAYVMGAKALDMFNVAQQNSATTSEIATQGFKLAAGGVANITDVITKAVPAVSQFGGGMDELEKKSQDMLANQSALVIQLDDLKNTVGSVNGVMPPLSKNLHEGAIGANSMADALTLGNTKLTDLLTTTENSVATQERYKQNMIAWLTAHNALNPALEMTTENLELQVRVAKGDVVAVKQLADASEAAGKAIVDSFNKAIEQTNSAMSTFSDIIGASGKKEFKEAFKGLKDAFKGLDLPKSTVSNIKDMFKDLQKNAKGMDAVAKGIDLVFTAIEAGGKKIKAIDITNIITGITDKLSELGKVNKGAAGVAAIFEPLKNLKGDELKKKISEIGDTIMLVKKAMDDGWISADEYRQIQAQLAIDTGKVKAPTDAAATAITGVGTAMDEVTKNNVMARQLLVISQNTDTLSTSNNTLARTITNVGNDIDAAVKANNSYARTITTITDDSDDWTKANNSLARTIATVADDVGDAIKANNSYARTIVTVTKDVNSWTKANNTLARTITEVGKDVDSAVKKMNTFARVLVNVGKDAASAAKDVKSLASSINSLKDKTVTVTTKKVTQGAHAVRTTATNDNSSDSTNLFGGGGGGSGHQTIMLQLGNELITRHVKKNSGTQMYRFGH